ncbi:MAG: glycosyltransferase family 2 protein [bacterium]
MYIVVQIPCLDEEASIGAVIKSVPRHIPGAERVEVLVVDDGSSDRSESEAREAGADHLVRFAGNRGLAKAFEAGMDAALRLGADVIMNMDADGQYRGEDVPRLVEPIINGEADVVVGDRGIKGDPDYPAFKKVLQVAGTSTVRALSGTPVWDAASGFRAYSREAALRLNLVSDFTYTLESLIQAGKDRLKVKSVKVDTNQVKRPSRLFKSLPQYMAKSASTLVRIYSMYEPLKVFSALGAAIFAGGLGIGCWFVYYFITEGGKGHVQILILSAVLLIIGFQILVMALVADLIGSNRKLLGDLLYRVKRMEQVMGKKPAGTDRE